MVYVFPIERESQKAIIAGAVVFSLLPTAAVVLRMVARSRLKVHALDLSDWLILAACVSFLARSSVPVSLQEASNEIQFFRLSQLRTKHSQSPALWLAGWDTTRLRSLRWEGRIPSPFS